jgi:osmotically-inducible protein OsmY
LAALPDRAIDGAPECRESQVFNLATKTPIVVGGVALAALALLTMPGQVRRIDADLRARAQQSLASAGSVARVEVVGRDVVLSGEVADEAARRKAKDTVADLWGVRRVVDRMQVAVAVGAATGGAAAVPAASEPGTRRIGALPLPTVAPAAVAHSSSVRVSVLLGADGAVTLNGQAPTESARAAISERARRIFGDDKVRDRLRAARGDEQAGWREAVFEGLLVLRRLERGRMDATTYRIRVGGIAVDAATEGEIAAALRNVAPSDLQIAVDVDTRPRRETGAAHKEAEG